jgi:hypothetical protein
MNGDELERAYGTIRQFALDHGLEWVLTELDEAIAIGVLENRELRQSTRGGHTIYEDAVPTPGPTRRRNVEVFLSRRPMTTLEKIDALLGALRRVLLDLDAVARESITQLNRLPAAIRSDVDVTEPSAQERDYGTDRAPASPDIEDIDFVPDDGGVGAAVSTEAMRFDSGRGVVSRILDELAREVSA